MLRERSDQRVRVRVADLEVFEESSFPASVALWMTRVDTSKTECISK